MVQAWADSTPDYLTLTATSDNTVIGIDLIGSPNISTLQYSYDGSNWNNITGAITFDTLQNGEFIKFRSSNQITRYYNDTYYDNYIQFNDASGSYAVSGNINTLIKYTDVDNAVLGGYAFLNLFNGCTHLTDASDLLLPSMTLTSGCYYGLFEGCTSLTSFPVLPATTLAAHCYHGMFANCSSMTEAPVLPATTMEWCCYETMFSGCSSLTEAPELPATTLAGACYHYMFSRCSSLINAPVLPAINMEYNCYGVMFWQCTSLTNAPILPATIMAEECYSYMFAGCSSLISAPSLPATTLAKECYRYMFSGCTSLKVTPILPATTLVDGCYYGMFEYCTSLSNAACYATSWNSECAENWLNNVSTTGNLYNLGGANIPVGSSGIPVGWTEHYSAFPTSTITVSANNTNYGTVTGGGTFDFFTTATVTATPNTGYTFVNWTENDVEVSTDAEYSFTVENDRNLVSNFAIQTFEVTVSANDPDYGTVTGGGTFDYGTTATLTATPNISYTFINWTENDVEVSTDAEYSFTVENDRNLVANFEVAIDYLTLTALEDNTIVGLNINGTPNISTLQYSYDGVNWNAITESITFNTLLNGQYIKFRSENQVSNNESSYINFYDESGSYKVSGNVNTLINYNDVDNVVLGGYAFYNLFSGCTHLTDASSLSLPSVVLSYACYQGMFMGCTSLTEAPELPAMDLAYECYKEFFKDCTSLSVAPTLSATNLEDHCYWGMFDGCTSLVEAPVLPATTMTNGSYHHMFYSCTSLTEAPALPATTLMPSCYGGMFYGCTSLIEAPELPATTLTGWCYKDMFRGCTSLTVAPELPATTLDVYCYDGIFFDCTSLAEAPALPATTLEEGCYSWMFTDCKALTEAPVLPATTLADGCYESMFFGCKAITEAPELPATTLAGSCYSYMFCNCSSLTQPPALPVTNLTGHCYSGMFAGCTSLTVAPALPATTLTIYCYYDMFGGCTSLSVAPELPATTLADGCYSGMFSCTSLSVAPELPATTLVNNCYYHMFWGCTSLYSVTTHATTWNTEYAQDWLYGVSVTGNFYNLGGADIPIGTSGIPEGWTEHGLRIKTITAVPNDENFGTVSGYGSYFVNETCTLTATPNTGYTFINWTENDEVVSTDAEYDFTVETDRSLVANFIITPNYFTLTATENNTVIGIMINGVPDISTLEYSYNSLDWNKVTETTTFNTLQTNEFVKFRSRNQVTKPSNDFIGFTGSTGSFKASGDIMTLIDFTDVDNAVMSYHSFGNLFYNCNNLIDISNLVLAETLDDGAWYCYSCMFYGCTGLTSIPSGLLPATTLTHGCYSCMFKNCTGLTNIPINTLLPATSLAVGCYENMFEGCTGISNIPWLPSTTLVERCYESMFKDCTGISSIPALPATTLANGCYKRMFSGCSGLNSIDWLTVPTLVDNCFCEMFKGCSSLNSVAINVASWNSEFAHDWLANVSETGEFYNRYGADIPIGASGIPEGWTEYGPRVKTITAIPNDENFGTVSGAGSFIINETCTLTATPNTGYTFVNWTENDIEVSTDTEYSFTVENDRNLVANFVIQTFEIVASANNSDYGTVTGGGTLDYGTMATLTATPNSGYTFINWTENDVEVSTDAEYSFTVENDRNLVANFQSSGSGTHWNPDISLYSDNMSVVAEIHIDGVVQTSTDIEIGAFCDDEVRGSRRVEYKGTPFDKYVAFLTIYGESNDNITFKVYDHQNNEELNCRISQSLTFTPNGTVGDLINPYVIEFFTTANITATANPAVGGTVIGDGVYSVGEMVTLTATADEYYRFVNWTENDVEVSTSETYSFTAFDDRSLVANFEIKNHWVPDESLYADNMSIVGEIQIDGVTQTSSDIEIGAFCGEEVRGSQRIVYTPAPIDKYLVFLTVYGESNDNITFKLYNHQIESEYDLTAPEPITFTPNATVGGLITPHILNFCHTQSRELTAGWNWYSTFIDIEGEDGFNMLTAGLGEDGLQVKSQSQFALYYPEYNIWTGSLNEADNTKLYMIQMSSLHTLVMTGAFTDVQSTPITINKGWTWIGYPVTESMSLDEATSNITPSNGDYFKSQAGFSIYYEGYGWVGSLNTLEPGRGYMYQNNGESSMNLVYPTPSAKNVLEENITADGNHWVPNAYQYADNMSVIAVININGVEQMSGNLEIGAFSNGECRGSARPIYIEATGRYMLFMTVYGEGGENLDFKLYDADKNEEYQLQAGMDFEPNGTVGNLANPYIFDLSVMGIGEEQPFAFGFYPNPVSSGKQLAIEGEYDRIEIINSIGVVIGEYTNTNKIEVTMIPGVYYIRAINDKSIIINKLVVK